MMYTTKKIVPLILQFCILLVVSDRTRTDAELLRAPHDSWDDRKDNEGEGLLSWLTAFGRNIEVVVNEEDLEDEERAIFEEEEKALLKEAEEAGSKVALVGDRDEPKYEIYGRDGRVEDILTENEMEQFIKENNLDEKEAALMRGEIVLSEEELEELIKEHRKQKSTPMLILSS